MSTRSRIGLKRADDSIESIYCHFDGYPEGVGKILKEHYDTLNKVKELLKLGDISTLGTFYDEELAKQAWNQWDLPDEERKKLREKTKNLTLPYKDRGEKGVSSRVDSNIYRYIEQIGNSGEDYTYLFQEDYQGVYRWTICETPWFKEY